MRSYRVLLSLALTATCAIFARADELEGAGLSREMKLGVRFFEKGDDMQAMDRFMEVLTRGDPAERSMANEYINLITRRMNGAGAAAVPDRPTTLRPNEVVAEPTAAPRGVEPTRPRQAEVVVEGADMASTVAAGPRIVGMPDARVPVLPTAPPVRESGSPSRPDKAVMKKEIKSKIRNLLDAGLRELKSFPDIKILMAESGDPKAVALPSSLLFQTGIAFQKDASKILDALTKVAYSLGSSQVVILPEGTALGDAKVLDMRRTMGISSHLLSAGLAAPRVKVNLLNTQVDFPKALMDFRGIVVLFVYNQPLQLVVESTIGEEGGPPLSLGVYPPSFRPDRGEGVIIEFSVQDPPAGLISWKFQLLQPSAAEGRDLAPLQEVVGGSPVFHQIYWNGHQNYFGPTLPAGRYECVLTATDGKNRQRTLHRWIQLVDSTGLSPRLLEKEPAPAIVPSGAPPAELTAAPAPLIKENAASISAVEVVPQKRVTKSAPLKRPRAAKAAPSASAAVEGTASGSEPPLSATESPKGTRPPSTSMTLEFRKATHQLTPDGERKLAGVADELVYYPLENLAIEGQAVPGEREASQLAERRSQMVAGLLINKYQIDPKRIRVSSKVSETAAPRVQIEFVRTE